MGVSPEPRVPFIRPGIDAEALADWFDACCPLEFCASDSFDPGFVDGLCGAGFIPMAARGPEEGSDFLLPKLHVLRSVLEPRSVRITATARRESRRYALGRDLRFDEILERCAETHGDDWLRPPLRAVFRELFATRESRFSRFSSFELYALGDRELVAGEIGVYAGACFTSLTGFRTIPGSGTVQLAATARWLEATGVRLWDLGMPLDYKLSLGASLASRGEFLGLFRAARSGSPDRLAPEGRASSCRWPGLWPARGLIDRALTER